MPWMVLPALRAIALSVILEDLVVATLALVLEARIGDTVIAATGGGAGD